jgi:beta-lactamase class A
MGVPIEAREYRDKFINYKRALLLSSYLALAACSPGSIIKDALDRPTPTPKKPKPTRTRTAVTATPAAKSQQVKARALLTGIMENSGQACGLAVIDALSGKSFFNYNEKEVFHPASSIKPIIALAAMQVANLKGEYPNELQIIAAPEVAGTRSSDALVAGQRYTMSSIVERAIIASDNQASNSLFNWMGASALKEFIQFSDLKSTRIERPYVNDSSEGQGKVLETTPLDAAKFMFLLETLYDQGNPNAQFINSALLKSEYMVVPHDMGNQIIVAGKPGFVGSLQGTMLSINDVTNDKTLLMGMYCNQNGEQTIPDAVDILKDYLVSTR